MVQLFDGGQPVFTHLIHIGKITGRAECAVGRTGNEHIDAHFAVEQTFGHHGRIALTTVVQRAVKILLSGQGPAAFGVSYDQ